MGLMWKGALLALGLMGASSAAAVDVARWVRKDQFGGIEISPNGDYFAATVPMQDRTVLVILRRSDNQLTARFETSKNMHVDGFTWVNPERVLISIAQKYGALDTPSSTGELFAINADGSQSELLVGYRVQDAGVGTKIQKKKKAEFVWADLVDDLPADDKNVLISVSPFSTDPFTRLERMDVYTGRRVQIARAPVRRASFVTDNAGVLRFASGAGSDNASKLYYRTGETAEWELINNEAVTGNDETPIGFSVDNRTAYLQVEHESGPDSIVAFDIATKSRKQLLRDDNVDPADVIYRNGTRVPVGAVFMDGKRRVEFFDNASPEARLQRSLESAFQGDAVHITSQTADGRVALVQVWNDRSPGDFFLFDTVAKKAVHLISRANWIDPAKMAPVRPVQLVARDKLPLHGYLTVPHGSPGRNLPTIVLPHGGPFGIRDVWGFDGEAQMLAEAGYAVLKVNFRGSGGYGRAFKEAGAKQWGLAMQDDLTDATRWLVEQGIADPKRICIYGASYGAYAALMGAAKEPDLYRCAVGYIGVYDLPTLHADGDTQETESGRTYLRDWVGKREELAAVSPTRMAGRITVPVFLAAGGEDERAPIQHSRMMERTLRQGGTPVETLYYDTEGHGFYLENHNIEYHTKLLDFFARHLGGKAASATSGQPATAR